MFICLFVGQPLCFEWDGHNPFLIELMPLYTSFDNAVFNKGLRRRVPLLRCQGSRVTLYLKIFVYIKINSIVIRTRWPLMGRLVISRILAKRFLRRFILFEDNMEPCNLTFCTTDSYKIQRLSFGIMQSLYCQVYSFMIVGSGSSQGRNGPDGYSQNWFSSDILEAFKYLLALRPSHGNKEPKVWSIQKADIIIFYFQLPYIIFNTLLIMVLASCCNACLLFDVVNLIWYS